MLFVLFPNSSTLPPDSSAGILVQEANEIHKNIVKNNPTIFFNFNSSIATYNFSLKHTIIIARIWAIVNKKPLFYTKFVKLNVKEDMKVIVFDKLWKTMKEKNVSQYQLIKKYGFSTGQLDRLRKNENVNSYTLNTLCEILECKLEDIAEFIPTQKNKGL